MTFEANVRNEKTPALVRTGLWRTRYGALALTKKESDQLGHGSDALVTFEHCFEMSVSGREQLMLGREATRRQSHATPWHEMGKDLISQHAFCQPWKKCKGLPVLRGC